ncbi:hypothetical protein F8203_gp075 [Heliothis virescens ascovirus 3f]|uniref:Uncharacterized protein n=1 Tax=Heliothis virescens ascovirus 3f TaxID=328614 RepID=A0A171PVH3_9VIRU|nr:hypothetical protein F8203_gp075 [Heliothis virescens ascovirus 3f]AJP09041.1 hypothetical protein [Heliothis virescens ascovirus 3f]
MPDEEHKIVDLNKSEIMDLAAAVRLDIPKRLSHDSTCSLNQLIVESLKTFRFDTHTTFTVRKVLAHRINGFASPSWDTPVRVRVSVVPNVNGGDTVVTTGIWTKCAVSSHEVDKNESVAKRWCDDDENLCVFVVGKRESINNITCDNKASTVTFRCVNNTVIAGIRVISGRLIN